MAEILPEYDPIELVASSARSLRPMTFSFRKSSGSKVSVNVTEEKGFNDWGSTQELSPPVSWLSNTAPPKGSLFSNVCWSSLLAASASYLNVSPG